MSAPRLTRAEEALAHQAALIDELNEVVTQQAARIDRLERQVALLLTRAADAEAERDGQVILGDTPPPHY
ncbi:MAG: SlyX family protein [Pseudomonadota bacterium]